MVAVPFWAWSKIDKIDEPSGQRPDDQPGTNYLVGPAEADDLMTQQKALGTGPRGGTNTDTIIVLPPWLRRRFKEFNIYRD